MSDPEEPPSKLTKFEMESQYLEGEVMEDGQEEWLSEGILTDDDYPPAEQETDSNIGNTSQDTNLGMEAETSEVNHEVKADIVKDSIDQEIVSSVLNTDTTKNENIEETLNNLENSQIINQNDSFPDDLDDFLIRKTDTSVLTKKEEKQIEADSTKSDDGNDTDDLLRMLGDDGDKVKKSILKKRTEDAGSTDDDDYIFEGAKMRTLQVARNALIKKKPIKAESEDDATDMSSDEGDTMKRMFQTQQKKNSVKKAIVAVKSGQPAKSEPSKVQRPSVKKVIQVANRPRIVQQSLLQSPVKQYSNKRMTRASSGLAGAVGPRRTPRGEPDVEDSEEEHEDAKMRTLQAARNAPIKKKPIKAESEDDVTDMSLPERREREQLTDRQRIMRPEQMDEEVPTDAESDTDEDSLYDELPSSDSENLDEWFTLDIRAERAGDYIPLLGDKAHQLLSEEKRRVALRLSSLKKSLSALSGSGKEQAEQLRKATHTLAELDAMLKAA